ncbi:MAG TPA: VapE family protein [Bacteroidales bacterium]|nr:VapE family protein [Bacteroidales bacterium]HOX78451.1 VapE family protein [Bacteroidales bacterium]
MKAAKKQPPIVEIQHVLNSWYDLRFNEIRGVVEGRKKDEEDYKELNENNLFIQLLSNGYKVSITNLCALLNSEYVPTYNPFREYFESLKPWQEGGRDFILELANYVEAVDQQQYNHHFKKALVRMIACALEDNTFNKQAFILVGGKQNTGKSTFCRYLCPPALRNYYTETIPGDKDALISLCENFIINLDELSTLSKFELNNLKSMFSKDRVKIRHPFDRKSKSDPRRASFIGSTNEDNFLTDTTGSVRWLCFEIVSINWDYKNIDINQVWSQAYTLFKSGFKYQLTPEEIRLNELRNEQYQQVSMEYEYVQAYLSPGTPFEHDDFLTTTQIRDYILIKTERKAEIKNTDKLGRALKNLGFTRVVKRTGESNSPTRGYYLKYLHEDKMMATCLPPF